MARPFKICPDCGAHLDASEPCDCKDAIEREPPKPRERLKLLAVCREVDKESGRVSVYPLDLEITSEILASLKMRAQFNPELRYFTTTTARWDRYGEVMAGYPETPHGEPGRFGQYRGYLRDMRRNEPTPEEQEVEEMKQAARVIKEICDRRTADDACSFCPFYDMCRTEPYTWEV